MSHPLIAPFTAVGSLTAYLTVRVSQLRRGAGCTLPRRNRSDIPRPQIETLSDLVFGLALSIGALALIGRPAATASDVTHDVLGFLFSFAILISVWIRYSSIMSVLPVEDGGSIMLNIILLFLVSIEPYLFSLVTAPGQSLKQYASVLYALDLGGLMTILALFTHLTTIEERGLIKRELIGEHKQLRNINILCAAFFLISLLPVFWSWTFNGTPLRFYLWGAPLVLVWISRTIEGAGKLARRF